MFVPPLNVTLPSFTIPSPIVSTSVTSSTTYALPAFTVIVLWLTVAPLEFVTSPSINKSPAPLITFVFVPPVNIKSPSLFIVITPAGLILLAFVVNPAADPIFISAFIIAVSSFVNIPLLIFIVLWLIFFLLTNASSTFNIPAPDITLLFVPPVYINVPAFVISPLVLILSALVSKLLPVVIITFFCSTSPLFVTTPSIITSPSTPVIAFVFSPPVNFTVPSFAIPFAAFIAFADDIITPPLTTESSSVATIASALLLLFLNVPATVILD